MWSVSQSPFVFLEVIDVEGDSHLFNMTEVLSIETCIWAKEPDEPSDGQVTVTLKGGDEREIDTTSAEVKRILTWLRGEQTTEATPR
jgi:hypothetical protein